MNLIFVTFWALLTPTVLPATAKYHDLTLFYYLSKIAYLVVPLQKNSSVTIRKIQKRFLSINPISEANSPSRFSLYTSF